MDAAAQLALMTKAKLVFETPGTFLSFPVLDPLTYRADQLRFGTGTVADLGEASEFARIANVMPEGVVTAPAGGEVLWEVCADVLQAAEVAAGSMTAQDKARYDKAVGYLYETSIDGGLRRDSAVLRTYKQCRDAYISAVEDYKAGQLTAQTSTDSALAAAWQGVEQAKRLVVSELQAAWDSTGSRDMVEEAMQVEVALGGRSPIRRWSEWRSALVDVLDLATDTAQNRFAATGFAPANVFDAGPWPSMTLSHDEIAGLVAQAPPELTSVLGGGAVDGSDIASLSFEYRSVAILRPWFRPEMLTTGFWRLGPDGGELSDGGSPAAGRCPSYVAGMVFVRNVVVQTQSGGGWHRQRGRRMRDLFRVSDEVQAQFATVESFHLPTLVAESALEVHMTALRETAAPVPQPSSAAARLQELLGGQSFTMAEQPQIALDHVQAEFAPLDATLVAEPETPDEPDITVLAFICKRTPRCPDPAEGMQWPFGTPSTSSGGGQRTYVVVGGDTLAKIAARFYGDSSRWHEIADRNGVRDPHALQIGTKLVIP